MKKSYDYFKTLNLLSENISVIYLKAILNNDFSAQRVSFFAEKSELINNLRNEFITPFERGDIFLLAMSLTEELNAVLSLSENFSLIKTQKIQGIESLCDVLKEQNIIFGQLKKFKSNLRLFEQCSEEVKKLNSEKKKLERCIVDALNCKCDQPLLKYAVYASVLNLNRTIYKTIVEIERILINNS